MADASIEAKIGANVEGFRRGATEARSHVDGLIGQLKDFKSEAVSTGRQARFFAAELAEIIPGADGAKNAIRDLITVGLAGGGIHSLIAGVKFLIEGFHELTAEEDKAKENFNKFIEDQKKSVDALQVSIEKMLMTMRGATRAQILEFEQTHDLLEQKKQKMEELRKATADLHDDQERMNGADVEGSIGMSVLIGVSEKRVEGIRAEIKALDELLDKKRAALKPLAGADAAAARQQIALTESIEEAKRAAAQATVDAEINSTALKANQEIEEAQRTADFKEQLAREVAEAQMRANEATEESQRNLLRIQTEQEMAQKEAAAALALRAAGIKKAVTEMGTQFSAAIKGMIRGTLDLGDALKNIGLGAVDALIDGLVKMAETAIITALIGKKAAAAEAVGSTAGHTAAAIAGAAESQAFIPFAGPALAAAAAAEMAATLGAMTAPLLAVASAAGGMMVPHDMMAMVHEDERILPAKYSEGLDNLVMGGGGDVHVHLHGVVDGDSFRRLFNQPGFVREFKDAVRRGRL